MADQVNDGGVPDSPDEAKEGVNPQNTAGEDKVEVMEEVQRDAAKEREENRGYQ